MTPQQQRQQCYESKPSSQVHHVPRILSSTTSEQQQDSAFQSLSLSTLVPHSEQQQPFSWEMRQGHYQITDLSPLTAQSGELIVVLAYSEFLTTSFRPQMRRSLSQLTLKTTFEPNHLSPFISLVDKPSMEQRRLWLHCGIPETFLMHFMRNEEVVNNSTAERPEIWQHTIICSKIVFACQIT